MPNRLIHESSPYLLQHAHNPVNWYPYGAEAFAEALASKRPILISIGYSACHWCHVMEHESFSRQEVAVVMNRDFVCVKVDREERPDVDQIYMGAVQLLHGNGGWPLNCFALPDGRPFWGGTYFRPEQWIELLGHISTLFQNSETDLIEQAERIVDGIGDSNLIRIPEHPDPITIDLVSKAYEQLSWSFDPELGGLRGAPKFPMPVVWRFVLHYYRVVKNTEALAQLKTTLIRMAKGGIYDQIGGGFARYSTDASWKVPHFEKMLYDNAQLISLYANCAKLTGDKFFLDVVEKTIDFVFRELTSEEGLFYSALDADSEGEEGLFYLWTRQQMKDLLPEYGDLLADYWGVDGAGFWEKGKSILIQPADDSVFASQQHLSEVELKQLVRMAGNVMLLDRNKRTRPALDDKVLLSWNALMIKALTDACKVNGNQQWLDASVKSAMFIRDNFIQPQGNCLRVWKNGEARINAFLDDYAFLADAYIGVYQVTFDELWLQLAEKLCDYVIRHFSDDSGPLFWFTSSDSTLDNSEPEISRMINSADGVEPSGNAVMAGVLISLGNYLEKGEFIERAHQMLINMQDRFTAYPSSYSLWATHALTLANGVTTIAITGPEAFKNVSILNRRYYPGVLIAATRHKSDLPVLKDKFVKDQNLIYKCQGNTCTAPVNSIVDLLL
ncbi:MAG: thioredoxin domain-containing protein [Bacteroidetes bacterium HGW-Bacteroidetes-9]|jgi:hypothetical protein|nr:MAG: thioredoxin domain-containing protein [Bacteroidetes bacterium HGW-Bacteroidetes-9]